MNPIKTYLKATLVLLFSSWYTQAQCEVFKSEIRDVQKYMLQMRQLTDSLQAGSEIAAFGAQFVTARLNTKEVKLYLGKALTAADEAVTLVAEAQYESERCGLTEAMSYTIDAESHAIDARDFTSEAFENVKLAATAKNLGNLQYHMRMAQRLIREAQGAADAASHAAEFAHYSCSHDEDHARADK